MGKIIRLDQIKNKVAVMNTQCSRGGEKKADFGQELLVPKNEKPQLKQIKAIQSKQSKIIQSKVKEMKVKENFRVFVTITRLTGCCKMVLFNQTQKRGAEFFDLHFNMGGIVDYQVFAEADEAEMRQFLQMEEFQEITYEQGLDLLKDAGLQNFKFQSRIAWVERITSPHLQAAWLRTPQQTVETPKYYLDHLTARQLAQSYIKAVEQKDSSLIYDLYSEDAQRALGNRDIYSLNWTHEFDDFHLLKVRIVQETVRDQGEKMDMMLQVALTNGRRGILEAELYLVIIVGSEGHRLEKALVMDVSPMKMKSVVNPLQQKVFVAVFSVKNHRQIARALEEERIIDLTGEFEGGYCYKWFRTAQNIEEAVDLDNSYLAQIILTEKQIIIYSRQLLNLNKALDYFCYLLRGNCSFQAKSYDAIERIYGQSMVEKGHYMPTVQRGEHYYLSGEYYHYLLALCFMQPNYQCYQFKEGNFVIFEQREGICVEYAFFEQFMVINYFNTTLETHLMQMDSVCEQRASELILQCAVDFEELQELPHVQSQRQGKDKAEEQIERLFWGKDKIVSVL